MLIDLLATLTDWAADTAWMQDALCPQVDPEIFFPERGESPAPAKKVCALCPAREQCLSAALDRGEDEPGVWGGTTQHERRKMLLPELAA